jgi:hypothetical protein
MSDRIFLRLDERFALGTDDLQWILYRSRRADVQLDAPLAMKDWKPVSFIRSTKDILLRCMRENGCSPRIEAQVILAGYPSTFDAWKAADAALAGIPAREENQFVEAA